jgi:hypothetical protein
MSQIEANAEVPRNRARKLMTKYEGTHWRSFKRKGQGGGTVFELIPGQEELRRYADERVLKTNFAGGKSTSRRTSELQRNPINIKYFVRLRAS